MTTKEIIELHLVDVFTRLIRGETFSDEAEFLANKIEEKLNELIIEKEKQAYIQGSNDCHKAMLANKNVNAFKNFLIKKK